MTKFLIVLFSCLLILVGVLILRTLLSTSKQIKEDPIKETDIDDSCIRHLSEAIQIPTISHEDASLFDSKAFHQFHQLLSNSFPLCHSKLKLQPINNYSLVYKWEGSDLNLKPMVIMAHMDVVPINGQWQVEPFSGAIKDGFVWGRGAIDDKGSLIGILEATERLLRDDFKPKRTIYIAFGHDEEISGHNGAAKIVEWMKAEKIEAEFILDEGMVIGENMVPGVEKPVAMIGVAEKGFLTLKLSITIDGGHSSMPSKSNCISILSKALTSLNEKPLDVKIIDPISKFWNYIGPEMPFLNRLIFANRWLFNGVLVKKFEESNSGNAMIRTTIAPVIVSSGIKENIIPTFAEAILNLRTLPGHSNETIIVEIKERIKNDNIKIEILNSAPASSVSSTDSLGFKLIQKTVAQIFPDVVIAPSLMIAGTDTKHYNSISPNIYRFFPARMNKEDLARFHGANERIGVEVFKDVIRFYTQLIKQL